MANYVISKSRQTNWYVWACKDGSGYGTAATKSGAKTAAKAACGNENFEIILPFRNIAYLGGNLAAFICYNLEGNEVTHLSSDISEAQLDFWMEESGTISDADKALVILKIWGIYRSGTTVAQIKDEHDLSTTEFERLIDYDYSELEIDINDTTNEITWDFTS